MSFLIVLIAVRFFLKRNYNLSVSSTSLTQNLTKGKREHPINISVFIYVCIYTHTNIYRYGTKFFSLVQIML